MTTAAQTVMSSQTVTLGHPTTTTITTVTATTVFESFMTVASDEEKVRELLSLT
jgi:hypothetical protein